MLARLACRAVSTNARSAIAKRIQSSGLASLVSGIKLDPFVKDGLDKTFLELQALLQTIRADRENGERMRPDPWADTTADFGAFQAIACGAFLDHQQVQIAMRWNGGAARIGAKKNDLLRVVAMNNGFHQQGQVRGKFAYGFTVSFPQRLRKQRVPPVESAAVESA